ncbi:MAG: DMT family transporter [Xanthobacteraceae bacterium]|nr:DMT family transporter [Xanthobacteraceae bacterium]
MNVLKAVSLKILSTLMFAVMGAQVRYLEGIFPVGQVAFFRSLFALIPLLVFFALRGELGRAFKTKHPSAHLIRGVFSITGTFCTFAALARIPIGDFTAIAFVAPLITVVFAATMLKETVHAYRWGAVVAGFGGVMLMLSPYFQSHAAVTSSAIAGIAFAFANAISGGGATIQIRQITQTETTAAILTYMTLIVMGAALLTLPFGWIAPATWEHWVLLIGIGVAGGLGQMTFTESYRYAPASFLAPFDYTAMLWAYLLGYWIFAEVATPWVLLGAVIIAASGIFVILRERYLGLKRLRDMPVAAIGAMADHEPDPDAPVTALAQAPMHKAS